MLKSKVINTQNSSLANHFINCTTSDPEVMSIVSDWWKYYVIIYYFTSLPIYAFSDVIF